MKEYLDWVAGVQRGEIGRELGNLVALDSFQQELEDDEALAATTYRLGYTHVDVIENEDKFETIVQNHEEQRPLGRRLGFYAIKNSDLFD